MKTGILSFFAVLFLAFGSPAFSANIPITGEHMIIGTADYTFYATPVASGATYTWSVYSGTIVAQNTDPAAGPLYVTIHWTTPGLYQDYVEIADNQGNFGSFDVYVGVSPFAIQNNVGNSSSFFVQVWENPLQYSCFIEQYEAVNAGNRQRAVKSEYAIA